MANILIIDDEEQIRNLLKRVFGKLGHTVVTAENGSVGLKILHQEVFDLVVTDIFMPEKEGMETIMEIKRDFPSVKIIAMSGGDRSGIDFLPMTKALGASNCISKPFSNEEIVKLFESVLAD
ncbi:MAG: response regulator [Desulfobulbaceae bacterium]|nr:response regulator [Desulfobulbaceae bacterium]